MKNIFLTVLVLGVIILGAWLLMHDKDDVQNSAMLHDETTVGESAPSHSERIYSCSNDAKLSVVMGSTDETAGVVFTTADGNYTQEVLPRVTDTNEVVYEGYGLRVEGSGDTRTVVSSGVTYTCTVEKVMEDGTIDAEGGARMQIENEINLQ